MAQRIWQIFEARQLHFLSRIPFAKQHMGLGPDTGAKAQDSLKIICCSGPGAGIKASPERKRELRIQK